MDTPTPHLCNLLEPTRWVCQVDNVSDRLGDRDQGGIMGDKKRAEAKVKP